MWVPYLKVKWKSTPPVIPGAEWKVSDKIVGRVIEIVPLLGLCFHFRPHPCLPSRCFCRTYLIPLHKGTCLYFPESVNLYPSTFQVHTIINSVLVSFLPTKTYSLQSAGKIYVFSKDFLQLPCAGCSSTCQKPVVFLLMSTSGGAWGLLHLFLMSFLSPLLPRGQHWKPRSQCKPSLCVSHAGSTVCDYKLTLKTDLFGHT